METTNLSFIKKLTFKVLAFCWNDLPSSRKTEPKKFPVTRAHYIKTIHFHITHFSTGFDDDGEYYSITSYITGRNCLPNPWHFQWFHSFIFSTKRVHTYECNTRHRPSISGKILTSLNGCFPLFTTQHMIEVALFPSVHRTNWFKSKKNHNILLQTNYRFSSNKSPWLSIANYWN